MSGEVELLGDCDRKSSEEVRVRVLLPSLYTGDGPTGGPLFRRWGPETSVLG